MLPFLIAGLLLLRVAIIKKRKGSRKRCRKIDTRDSYENWLDKMAKKSILDLLPRNLEFHNLSQVNLTETQSRTLGLGLKFRPSLRPPTARVFDCQIQDFCCSVRLHYKYANKPDDPDFNPKLYVKSGWNPPREDPNLEESLYNIRQDLLESFNQNKHAGETICPLKNGADYVKSRKTLRFAFSLRTKTLDRPSSPQNG